MKGSLLSVLQVLVVLLFADFFILVSCLVCSQILNTKEIIILLNVGLSLQLQTITALFIFAVVRTSNPATIIYDGASSLTHACSIFNAPSQEMEIYVRYKIWERTLPPELLKLLFIIFVRAYARLSQTVVLKLNSALLTVSAAYGNKYILINPIYINTLNIK